MDSMIQEMISNARDLASSDGGNAEYDRALVEFVCTATGNTALLDNRDEAELFVLGRIIPNPATVV